MGITRNCFGCGPDNAGGLKMTVHRDGEDLVGRFQPSPRYEGYPGLMHGGVVCTALDEIMAYVPYYAQRPAMTARMNVDFHRGVSLTDSRGLSVRGRMLRDRRRLLEVQGELYLGEELKAHAHAVMYVLSARDRRRMGLDAPPA